jgi:hypothetical protein
MRRIAVIVAFGALLGLFGGVATASPALAGRGPKWQPPGGPPYTLPASFCGFKLRVAFPVNKEYTKVLKNADGSTTFLFTGAVTASYTNLQTGKTITVPENGPGKATIHADGSITEVHTGRNGPFILSPADAKRFGLPTVSVTAGKLAFSATAPPRVITSLSLHGHVLVNVCAALT